MSHTNGVKSAVLYKIQQISDRRKTEDHASVYHFTVPATEYVSFKFLCSTRGRIVIVRIVASIEFCLTDIPPEIQETAKHAHVFLPGNSSVKEGDNITLTCAPSYVRSPYQDDDFAVGHLKCEQNALRLTLVEEVACLPRKYLYHDLPCDI